MTAPLLVVLVDNHVVGDSRVQKCAIAAAEAGYRVVLLGRADGVPDTFTIGRPGARVEVRRVDAPFRLLALSRRAPRGRWRYPLAYPSADHSAYQGLRLKALAADLRARRILADRRPGGPDPVHVLLLRAEGAVLRARRFVHLARGWSLRRLVDRVKDDDSLGRRWGARVRRAVRGPGAWRGLDPVLLDMELGFGPVLDELAPDLLHANDFRTCGVAARAAARAAAEGRDLRVVYDVHELVSGVVARSLRWRTANTGHEAEYVGRADAVVTVSDVLADQLQDRYRLPARPRVVLNAPDHDPDAEPPRGGVRAACGLPPDVPLLVYCGSAAPQRGLEDAVDALRLLPAVHLALVIEHESRAAELEERAAGLGVLDRLHVLGYVAQDEVVPFLRCADAGLVPLHHVPNHEVALITKYLEYAHAGLPVVTSDTAVMGGTTRELGNGEVFRATDVADLARAVRAVLDDPARYRSAYVRHADVVAEWSWPRQREVLLDVYARVLGDRAPARQGARTR